MIFEEAVVSPLARWENFYVIVGSSAGALTGLQFVVMALIADAQAKATMHEVRAFGTPTVVHFLCLAARLGDSERAVAHAFWCEHCLRCMRCRGSRVCGQCHTAYTPTDRL